MAFDHPFLLLPLQIKGQRLSDKVEIANLKPCLLKLVEGGSVVGLNLHHSSSLFISHHLNLCCFVCSVSWIELDHDCDPFALFVHR